jgi:predicted MFS family arabinose efflux permease
MLIFIYFNCVNSVSIYNAEIEPFTNSYEFSLTEQTITSMMNCVAGIIGSIYLGKYLDKLKLFKGFQIMLGIAIPITVLITFLCLHFNAPNLLVDVIATLGGAPMSSVSVVSYQFAAEVVYPISEV